jgi:hypothetical protein
MSDSKERYFTEVARLINAVNQAIVLIGVLTLLGISFAVADMKIADDDRTNQEVSNAYVR